MRFRHQFGLAAFVGATASSNSAAVAAGEPPRADVSSCATIWVVCRATALVRSRARSGLVAETEMSRMTVFSTGLALTRDIRSPADMSIWS